MNITLVTTAKLSGQQCDGACYINRLVCHAHIMCCGVHVQWIWEIKFSKNRYSQKLDPQNLALYSMTVDPASVCSPWLYCWMPEQELVWYANLCVRCVQISTSDNTSPLSSLQGEFGVYLVSDGTSRPYRCRIRAPGFFHLVCRQLDVWPFLVSVYGTVEPLYNGHRWGFCLL